MSSIRSFKRAIIRNQCYKKYGGNKTFKAEWDKYRNESVIKNTNKNVESKSITEKTEKKKNKFSLKNVVSKIKKNKDDNKVNNSTKDTV